MELRTLRQKVPKERLSEFCRKWKIKELGIFGSFLRDDFHDQSDIDVLVSFSRDSEWSLFHLVDMQKELSDLMGREVDIVEKEALKNPFRRKGILNNVEVLYET
jgi:predicted nucleotidyltransferase